MTPRRAGAITLLTGALLLALAWRLSPVAVAPLYDGLTGPAEPYRYLNPPPGIDHPKPNPVSRVVALVGGQLPATVLTTDEVPPQAQLLINAGGVAVPPGTTSVTVSITPVPPARPPSNGRLDGNVYRFEVVAGTTPLQLAAGQFATVVLRGPAGAGPATIERLDPSGWLPLATTALTQPDIYTANTDRLGDLALVIAGSAGGTTSGTGGGGAPVVLIVVIALVVIAVIAVVLVRIGRDGRGGGSGPAPPGTDPRRRRRPGTTVR